MRTTRGFFTVPATSTRNRMKNKKAQEEIVGFAMIIILVAVILLIFLGISLSRNKSQNVESYEAESFVQSMLQYTTTCQDNFGYLPVKDLIFLCNSKNDCLDGSYSCNVLNSTLEWIMNQSWNVGTGSSIKGYSLNITSDTGNIMTIKGGGKTSTSIGTSQDFAKGAESVHILLRVYS